MTLVSEKLLDAASQLSRRLARLRFGSAIHWVYNPLVYAAAPHRMYVERYGATRRSVILLGMNPGPWGMMQTGVPFGAVSIVRDWLGISANIKPPLKQHPRRPIEGFQCNRQEVSGARFWGWAKDTFVRPEGFFADFFVANYCPLVFLEESGRNATPDRLPRNERAALNACCDEALRTMVSAMRPEHVVGVGNFAAAKAQSALAELNVTVTKLLHPSPASPAANQGWAKHADKVLLPLARSLRPQR